MIIFFIFINILISLFNISISIKLNVKKNNHFYKKNISSLKFRILNNNNYSSIDLPLLKSELGLYSIDINIGEPNQKFSLVIDSGSSILWVYNNKCEVCKSKNKFSSSDSKTFISKKETINLNYVTGKIKGELCQDNMNFQDKLKMPLFYFLLVYESDLDFDMDGIIGLSKGGFIRKEYSFLNQLYEKKLIKENFLLYDLHNKLFYIGEIPPYLMNEKNISCYDDTAFSNFWRCEMSSIIIDNVPITIDTNIIFDSGTNGIVFPMKYLDIFKNIIANNDNLTKSECVFLKYDDSNIYKFICTNNNNFGINYLNFSYNFIEIFLDKNINNSFGFNLLDLLEQVEDDEILPFALYIYDRKEEILLGAPFFEKYPIMFNKDNNMITIFGEGNTLYNNIQNNKNKNYKNNLRIFIIVTLVIIFILLIIIIIRKYFFEKKRIKNEQIEFLADEYTKNKIIKY